MPRSVGTPAARDRRPTAATAAIVISNCRNIPRSRTRWASLPRYSAADAVGRRSTSIHADRRTAMPQQVLAVVVDPAAPGKLAIELVELRDPDRDEVAVQVTAISLNRGETRRAVQQAEPGWRPGWDFVGVIETAAAGGSGAKSGTRVVGILPSGAWAERVNCRTHAVAALPDAVGDAEAATLPVAGLTALAQGARNRLIATAIYHCTFTAAGICWRQSCAAPT